MKVVSDHDEDFFISMVIFVHFIKKLGFMCSAMEEIKEKVFDVEEEHNLCEKLSN